MTLVVRDPAPDSRELGYVRAALERGELVVVPTDTVYGIAAAASDEAACARLASVKGLAPGRPIAVAFTTLADLLAFIPELSDRALLAAARLLPGPWTLLVNNPAHRAPWLCGDTPDVLGVRVPAGALQLPPIAATSANVSGAPEAIRPAELPASLLDACAVAVDVGALSSGIPSTVLDITAWERTGSPDDVRIVRDPAHRAATGIDRLRE